MNQRQQILSKSNGRCWYCGIELQKGWHVDHFQPVRRYNGEMTAPENDVPENLVPSCPSCNIMKSDRTIEGFRSLLANLVKSLNRDISIYRHAKRYGLVEESEKEVKFWFEELEK
mgnify:CR=1 FL=1